MQLFCCEQREIILQRKAGLRAENGIGSGAGAVGFKFPVVENEAEKFVILEHKSIHHLGTETEGEPRLKNSGPLRIRGFNFFDSVRQVYPSSFYRKIFFVSSKGRDVSPRRPR